MDKRARGSTPLTRVYLTLECALEVHTSHTMIQVFVSSVGQPDVRLKEWKAPQGRPTDSQTRDLAHYVAKQVTDATVAFCGVQEQLDVTK